MNAYVRRDAAIQIVIPVEVPVPEAGDHEVLVDVRAFGVGIHDRYFIPSDARFPYVIGTEAAGVVVKAGSRIESFGPGDRVLFASVLNLKGGTWAELAVTNPHAS